MLLLLADDMRPDAIAASGHPMVRTPNLDRLVREGTSFTRAMTAYPVCVPSRLELLTGRLMIAYPRAAPPTTPRWPAAMAEAGYETWYVGKWDVPGRPNDYGFRSTRGLFAQGRDPAAKATIDQDANGRAVTGYPGYVFQSVDGEREHPERGVGLYPGVDRDLAGAAISVIREKRDRPFFLQLSFTAPHDPLLRPPGDAHRYDPALVPLPPNFAPQHPFDHGVLKGRDELLWPAVRTEAMVRDELAVYYAVISSMDEQVGRIVKALEESGQLAHTLIVFASDNGLAIGSHGLRGKQNMYDHSVGVPLVLRGPGVGAGRRSAAQVYLRDVYPTVCDLAGVEPPGGLDARSFAPVVRGEAESVHDAVFAYYADVQRMVRTDRWKLIRYPRAGREQLFDLHADPHELHDLSTAPRAADIMHGLRARLTEWQAASGDPLTQSR